MKQLICIIIVLFGLLTGSCTNDEIFTPDISHKVSENTIIVSIASTDIIATRSGESNENVIGSCYLVAYDRENPTSHRDLRFFEKIAADKIKIEGANQHIIFSKENYEKLETGDYLYLILNPTEENYTREGLIQELDNAGNHISYFKLGAANGIVSPSSNMGVPMYGSFEFSKNATIEINVRHSVSKISLNIANGINDRYGDFNANQIHYALVQTVDTAYIDGRGTPFSASDAMPSYSGSFPYRANVYTANQTAFSNVYYPLSYPYSTYYKSTSEISAPLDPTMFDSRRFCLLLFASGRKKYYRVDLFKDGSYLDLLTNTFYKINITNVYNGGYNTIDEALTHPSTNIEFDVAMENPEDGLISNGQFAMKVDENPIKTYIDLTHHPLLHVNNNGTPATNNIALKDTTIHLTTITRKLSAAAPISTGTWLRDMKFTAEKIGTAGNIAVDLILTVGGREVSITSVLTADSAPTSRTVSLADLQLGDEAYELKIRFTGWGQVKYSYSHKLGNIEYKSGKFNYTLGYQYNSNERQRRFDLGRSIPLSGVVKWTGEGGHTAISGSSEQYYFLFHEDNSKPIRWQLEDGTAVHSGTSKAAPVFADKVLSRTSEDLRIRIIQAQPFYIGRYNGDSYVTDQSSGIPMCVAGYNSYESTLRYSSSQNSPGAGSLFTWENAIAHGNFWEGEGLISSSNTGWRLPVNPVRGGLFGEMYHKVFHNANDRGGSSDTETRWWNDYAIDFGEQPSRINFLPTWGAPFTYYWMSTNSALLFDDHLDPTPRGTPVTTPLAIRLVKALSTETPAARLVVTPATAAVTWNTSSATFTVSLTGGELLPGTKISYALSGNLGAQPDGTELFAPSANEGISTGNSVRVNFGINNSLEEKTGVVTFTATALSGQPIEAKATIIQAAGRIALVTNPEGNRTVDWDVMSISTQVTAQHEDGSNLGGAISYVQNGYLFNPLFVPSDGIQSGNSVALHFDKNYTTGVRNSNVQFRYLPTGSSEYITKQITVSQRANPHGAPKSVITENVPGATINSPALDKVLNFVPNERTVNLKLFTQHVDRFERNPLTVNERPVIGGNFTEINFSGLHKGEYSRSVTIPKNNTADDITYHHIYNVRYRNGTTGEAYFKIISIADDDHLFRTSGYDALAWDRSGNVDIQLVSVAGTFKVVTGFEYEANKPFDRVVHLGNGKIRLEGLTKYSSRNSSAPAQRDIVFFIKSAGENNVVTKQRIVIKQNLMPQPWVDPKYIPRPAQHNTPDVWTFRGHSGGSDDRLAWTGGDIGYLAAGIGRNVQFQLLFQDAYELQHFPDKRSQVIVRARDYPYGPILWTGPANGSRTQLMDGEIRSDGSQLLPLMVRGPWVGKGDIDVMNIYVLYFDLNGQPYNPNGTEGYKILIRSW